MTVKPITELKPDLPVGVASSMPTPEQISALAEAVWQVLDDMGENGTSACLAAKAALRVAFEPFLGENDPLDMSLEAAKSVLDELN